MTFFAKSKKPIFFHIKLLYGFILIKRYKKSMCGILGYIGKSKINNEKFHKIKNYKIEDQIILVLQKKL